MIDDVIGYLYDVSIHTLTRRVTMINVALGEDLGVSIHTLTRRVTISI